MKILIINLTKLKKKQKKLQHLVPKKKLTASKSQHRERKLNGQELKGLIWKIQKIWNSNWTWYGKNSRGWIVMLIIMLWTNSSAATETTWTSKSFSHGRLNKQIKWLFEVVKRQDGNHSNVMTVMFWRLGDVRKLDQHCYKLTPVQGSSAAAWKANAKLPLQMRLKAYACVGLDVRKRFPGLFPSVKSGQGTFI